ncbi:MAG TPA: DUF4034 domain-containing protein [Caldimonas sp.]|nr:DUF4034 domain-containing protein [Caldimonas sp.]
MQLPWRVLSCLATIFCVGMAHGQAAPGDLPLLRQGNFSRLEAETVSLQQRFATGQVTEFGLRQFYRSFYDLTEQDLARLDEWQAAYPRSYAVRLVRGTYYKLAAFKARGGNFAANTPPESFAEMERLLARARPDLEASLSLTEKPLLSVFHLLDMTDGNRAVRKALMDSGTRMLPSNRLIRGRYMFGLTPRWGGSYEEMKAFLAYAKRTGASKVGLMEMEALMYDDMAEVALHQGDQESAVVNFRKALELNAKVGPDGFGEPPFSKRYKCRLPALREYCR